MFGSIQELVNQGTDQNYLCSSSDSECIASTLAESLTQPFSLSSCQWWAKKYLLSKSKSISSLLSCPLSFLHTRWVDQPHWHPTRVCSCTSSWTFPVSQVSLQWYRSTLNSLSSRLTSQGLDSSCWGCLRPFHFIFHPSSSQSWGQSLASVVVSRTDWVSPKAPFVSLAVFAYRSPQC